MPDLHNVEPSDEQITTLLGMGFEDIEQIRRALSYAKNDLNEAVSFLTGEDTQRHEFGSVVPDLELKETFTSHEPRQSHLACERDEAAPARPPSYDDIVSNSQTSAVKITESSQDYSINIDNIPDEFPISDLYELENQISSDNWSIPYKMDESLGKCLLSSLKLTTQGICDQDPNYERFQSRALPGCFHKLMASTAVRRWSQETQDGVFLVTQLFIDLVACRLTFDPIPLALIDVLTEVFDADIEYHYKNRCRRWNRTHYEDVFGFQKCPAVSPSYSSYREPYGLLVNLINRFAEKNGFESLSERLESCENVSISVLATCLNPFGVCALYLSPEIAGAKLEGIADKAVKTIQMLQDNDFKNKDTGKVFLLLRTLKKISKTVWPDKVESVNEMYLDTILRMMKASHYNARMNAMKEMARLIRDVERKGDHGIAISTSKITDWLTDNQVLSISFEGNLHNQQYCEKMRKLIEFVGAKLSLDELQKIWSIQIGKHPAIVDNIHIIISYAAQYFISSQLEHLISLIKETWHSADKFTQIKLLILIGKIGIEIRDKEAIMQFLDLLWQLIHDGDLETDVIQEGLNSHLDILSLSSCINDATQHSYIHKCLSDIQQGKLVVPALRHMLQNLESMMKQPYAKGCKTMLQDLDKQHDLIKLVTNSLVDSHHQGANTVSPANTSLHFKLNGDTILPSKFSYGETIAAHLKFITMVLYEGGFYLPWSRAKEIWTCLVDETTACKGDQETAFEWFTERLQDLEPETQKNLFTCRILKTSVAKISDKGFQCFTSYFECVNQHEHKIKSIGKDTYHVEKDDLLGLSYLWLIVLQSPDFNVAKEATQFFIQLSSTLLSPKLRKSEQDNIHKKFIAEFHKRLEALLLLLKKDGVQEKSSFFKHRRQPSCGFSADMPRSTILICLERLLYLACQYISAAQDSSNASQRIYPPHGRCFHGYPVTIIIQEENNKEQSTMNAETNEALSSLHQRIAQRVRLSSDQCQLYVNDKQFSQADRSKLLHQLGFNEQQVVNVRSTLSVSSVSSTPYDEQMTNRITASSKEKEKTSPGYLLAFEYKAFDKFYHLAELEEPRITQSLRDLMLLLPTDPEILEALEVFNLQNPLTFSPNTKAGIATSSTSVFHTYFNCNSSQMSSFRVLYNLQVLTSKLMPTALQDGGNTTNKIFCDNFLAYGGLSLILNILHSGQFPSNVDYNLRQSCYYICLQIARFLLCGDSIDVDQNRSTTRTSHSVSLSSFQEHTSASSTMPSSNTQASDVSMATSTPIKINRVSQRTPRRHHSAVSSWPGTKFISGSPAAMVMDMSPSANNSMVSSSYESSACVTPDSVSDAKRPRAGSMVEAVSSTVRMVIDTMNKTEFQDTIVRLISVAWAAAAGQLHLNLNQDGNSNGHPSLRRNSSSDPNSLKSGTCLQSKHVDNLDANLSSSALQLLVMCLQLRTNFLDSFYKLSYCKDFIIDVLTGSPSQQVRSSAAEQFAILGDANVLDANIQQPKLFILSVLLKAPLPVWHQSSNSRGVNSKIIWQCEEYFELCCDLIGNLSESEQTDLNIDANQLALTELEWLQAAEPQAPFLLTGHLKLVNVILTCGNVDKEKLGAQFLPVLLNKFLSFTPQQNDLADSLILFNCRTVVLNLLSSFADHCSSNFCQITHQLADKYHAKILSNLQWDFSPLVNPRPASGFVGLKNAGATCYINSVLQQLYMQPYIRDNVLKANPQNPAIESPENLLYLIQSIFGHLMESRIEFFVPEQFWKSFRLWGMPVNVREQQDALEFFINITDQLDEQLKEIGKREIFKNMFCGVFADQKTCSECRNCCENDETFCAIPVPVKCGNLETSLQQFVQDEVMEGDNAYFCEKCRARRTTTKRTCIKTLPPVLVIQLKRFWYDWETSRAIKFDDYFKFPLLLDVEPYTSQGLSCRENPSSSASQRNPSIFYELVGVVVHSGQANAGHYYSFIKNRSQMCGKPNQWYKFNDTSVEEFEMTPVNLEAECFGGHYKVKNDISGSQYPEDRVRYWNGYLLFYETIDKSKCSDSSLLSPFSESPTSSLSSAGSRPSSPGKFDGIKQLSALIKTGDRKGLFSDPMPSSIQRSIEEENRQFYEYQIVYDEHYFSFIRRLCNLDLSQTFDAKVANSASQLAIKFLFNTYLWTTKELRADCLNWRETFQSLFCSNPQSCALFIDQLSSQQPPDYLCSFLVACPDDDTRKLMTDLIYLACSQSIRFNNGAVDIVESFIARLLKMFDSNIVTHFKQSSQYFSLLYRYGCESDESMQQLISLGAFSKSLDFLLGQTYRNQVGRVTRRWTSSQTRDFTSLHLLISKILLVSSVSIQDDAMLTESIDQPPMTTPNAETERRHIITSGSSPESERFVWECICATSELPLAADAISSALAHCATNNQIFTVLLLKQLIIYISGAQTNDLRLSLSLLQHILSIEDTLQMDRLRLVIDGSKEDNVNGILGLIRDCHIADPRRAYQCIKFLIGLVGKMPQAKVFLQDDFSNWQWCIEWLKQKMSEYYWTAQPHATNERHSTSSFQRTVSAQDTLAEATALISEFQKVNPITKDVTITLQPSFNEMEEDWDQEIDA